MPLSSKSISCVLFVAFLLLAHSPPPVDAHLWGLGGILTPIINRLANTVFDLAIKGLGSVQPYMNRVLDSIAQLRAQRGDTAGAFRAKELKGWFSFTGLHKGIPAMLAELYRQQGALHDLWSRGHRVYTQLSARAAQEGWPQAWSSLQPLVEREARDILTRAMQALPVGTVRTFLNDLMFEVRSDPQLASDLVKAVSQNSGAAGGYVEKMGPLVQGLMGALRGAFDDQVGREEAGGAGRSGQRGAHRARGARGADEFR